MVLQWSADALERCRDVLGGSREALQWSADALERCTDVLRGLERHYSGVQMH